jgi:hypothetical protein
LNFGILKGGKTKDYEDRKPSLAWEKLKEKFNPVSAPVSVKAERMFRENVLERMKTLKFGLIIWKTYWKPWTKI